jgi:hypothetical protein
MIGGDRGNGLNLDESDRLPWLEPAGVEEEPETGSIMKILGLVVIGLALLGGIVAAGYWLKNRSTSAGGGEAPLIAAEHENYKIPVNASDAKSFDGEGDEAFAASEGLEASGRIDASRVPEAPRDDLRAASATVPVEPVVRPAATKPTVSAPVKPTQQAARPAPAAPAAPAAKPAVQETGEVLSGPRVQLGAFATRAIAADVWKKHTSRFDYLSGLKHSVETVESNGRTLYRLRASVGSQKEGADICGRLRVAGENCMVVR